VTITFRKLTEKAELQQLEGLEAAVWSEDSVIPLHMTLTLAKFGGLFLGAFDQEEMIGFLYSFPGFSDGESHLCSHMLGFLPEYRKQGLGVQMKWLQREEALRLGHRKITWTYDPLETVNAYLNISKLGGIVRRYLPNCYGELNDEMNRGLPTDRFLVEWFITSKRVQAHHAGQAPKPDWHQAVPLLDWQDVAGHPVPVRIDLERTEALLRVAVPAHFQAVKRADMSQAANWRKLTGQLFQHYFAQGYAVTHVVRDETQPIVHYLLTKGVYEE